MARVETRSYFAGHHIEAAARFSRLAHGIEKRFQPDSLNRVLAEHRAYVVAAILSSVAFLEATINELFADAADSNSGVYSGFTQEQIQLLGKAWRIPKTPHHRVLEKYDIALQLLDKKLLDKGARPYQDVHALVELRNALVHYQPEWLPSEATREPDEIHKLEKLLRGRFELTPLFPKENPFYPDRCLGHGCAAWAAESSLAFAHSFYSAMGIRVSMVPTSVITQASVRNEIPA